MAKNWGRSTLDILTDDDEGMTLRGQLMVLFDSKQNTRDDKDDAYRMAKSKADAALMMLQMAASDAEEDQRHYRHLDESM